MTTANKPATNKRECLWACKWLTSRRAAAWRDKVERQEEVDGGCESASAFAASLEIDWRRNRVSARAAANLAFVPERSTKGTSGGEKCTGQ